MSIRAALAHCGREGPPGLFSCVDTLAAALPEGCELLAAYDVFQKLTRAERKRALQSPLASARLVAMKLKCARVPFEGETMAWGVLDGGCGGQSFAFRDGGNWWARSHNGLARMPLRTVLAAWECK